MTVRILKPSPDFNRERRIWRQGYLRIAGLDEVGRGAWAGPLAAAAVILPQEKPGHTRSRLRDVRDSKQMTPAARAIASELIQQTALAWSIGMASAAEVDQCGPLRATYLAMHRALNGLSLPPDHLLIDYLTLPASSLPQCAFPHGDMLSLSIASASVIAKVWRDQYMRELEQSEPGYGFASHKGYGTRFHFESLNRLGVSSQHRLSYAPVRRVFESQHSDKPV